MVTLSLELIPTQDIRHRPATLEFYPSPDGDLMLRVCDKAGQCIAYHIVPVHQTARLAAFVKG